MVDLSVTKLLVLAVIGLVIFGPGQLPKNGRPAIRAPRCGLPCSFSSRACSIFSSGCATGRPTWWPPASATAGLGGPLGGEGAFHLGEQRQQQEGNPAHALAGGVDG